MSLVIATKLARENEVVGLPRMAAILVCRNGVSVGLNSRKTHPLAKRFSKNGKSFCLHAEVDAIRRAVQKGLDTRGSILYISRVLKDGTPALAKPCVGCQRAIVAFEIEEVEWTE